jgi:uncharacterized protein YjiS (DUF1127 family)
MNSSPDLHRFPSAEDAPVSAPALRKVRATMLTQPRTADNDESCADPATPADDGDSWACHALAVNGFRDAVVSRPSSFDLNVAVRAYRDRVIGDMIGQLIARTWSMVRRAYARHRQYRLASATYDALRELDDHTLRDLGLYRDQISLVAAEQAGVAAPTRAHAGSATMGPRVNAPDPRPAADGFDDERRSRTTLLTYQPRETTASAVVPGA